MFQTKAAVPSWHSAMEPTGDELPTEPSSVNIERVWPHALPMVWPHLQRAFRKVQGRGTGDRMDEVAIVRALCEGSMELLVAMDEKVVGGVILQFVDRPKGRCCIVVASLFNTFHRGFPAWAQQMHEFLIDYAMRERGCYVIEAFARDGVIPALEQMGWRRKATVMEIR